LAGVWLLANEQPGNKRAVVDFTCRGRVQ